MVSFPPLPCRTHARDFSALELEARGCHLAEMAFLSAGFAEALLVGPIHLPSSKEAWMHSWSKGMLVVYQPTGSLTLGAALKIPRKGVPGCTSPGWGPLLKQ